MWNAKFMFTAAFVATTSCSAAFLSASSAFRTHQRLSTSTTIYANPVTSLLEKVTKKNRQITEKLEKEFNELKVAADQALNKFEELLQEAIKTKSEELTEQVAVEVVKMVTGEWELSILTVTNETATSTLMDSSAEDMAEDYSALGLDVTKSDMKQSRLKFTTALDDTAYPLRLETNILLGNTRVVKYYGQLQFDWDEKRVVYALDELEVFGVKIDLDSTVMKEAAGQKVKEDQETTDTIDETKDGTDDNEEEEEGGSIWKRVKSFFTKNEDTDGAVDDDAEIDGEQNVKADDKTDSE